MLPSKRCSGWRGSWCANHASVHSLSIVSALSFLERCAGSVASGQVWTTARTTKNARQRSARRPCQAGRGGSSVSTRAVVAVRPVSAQKCQPPRQDDREQAGRGPQPIKCLHRCQGQAASRPCRQQPRGHRRERLAFPRPRPFQLIGTTRLHVLDDAIACDPRVRRTRPSRVTVPWMPPFATTRWSSRSISDPSSEVVANV